MTAEERRIADFYFRSLNPRVAAARDRTKGITDFSAGAVQCPGPEGPFIRVPDAKPAAPQVNDEDTMVDRVTRGERRSRRRADPVDFADDPNDPNQDLPPVTWTDKIEMLVSNGDTSNDDRTRTLISDLCNAAADATGDDVWRLIIATLSDTWFKSNRHRDSLAGQQLRNAATFADAKPAADPDDPGAAFDRDLDADGDIDDDDFNLAKRAAMKSLF